MLWQMLISEWGKQQCSGELIRSETALLISIRMKILLYQSIILSRADYARKTWKITAKFSLGLNAFHWWCQHRMIEFTCKDRITNFDVLRRVNLCDQLEIVAEREKLADHIFWLPEEQMPKTELQNTMYTIRGTRKQREIQEDMAHHLQRRTRATKVSVGKMQAIMSKIRMIGNALLLDVQAKLTWGTKTIYLLPQWIQQIILSMVQKWLCVK